MSDKYTLENIAEILADLDNHAHYPTVSAEIIRQLLDDHETMRRALDAVIKSTHSHLDGRDLLAELHPRKSLDIVRRIDSVETTFEGDWLSDLQTEVIKARKALGEVTK